VAANSRRQFLADIGKGMLTAGLGLSAAVELGLVTEAFADEGPKRLCFGALDPLVGLMQETPPAKLQPLLVEKLRAGTDLRTLVAAAALANARTFGGEDYVGFHTMMALSPAYHMALVLPEARRPLPVLKVLYRNSNRIQERGTEKGDTLETVEAGTLPAGNSGGEALRQAVRQKDVVRAERTFAALAGKGAKELFHDLLFAVQDGNEVHRIPDRHSRCISNSLLRLGQHPYRAAGAAGSALEDDLGVSRWGGPRGPPQRETPF
jgi:hypothetical protein